MNETVAAYCDTHGLPARGLAHITRTIGLGRAEERLRRAPIGRLSPAGGARGGRSALALYEASRLFVNFFQPSFKLASKTSVGAKVRKTYYAPETRYAKLLSSAAVTDERKIVCEPSRSNSTRSGSCRRSDPCNTTWPHWPPGRPPLASGWWESGCLSRMIWQRLGNTARSAPPIAARRDARVIGGRARIRSRANGRVCAHRSRPSPTASVDRSASETDGGQDGIGRQSDRPIPLVQSIAVPNH